MRNRERETGVGPERNMVFIRLIILLKEESFCCCCCILHCILFRYCFLVSRALCVNIFRWRNIMNENDEALIFLAKEFSSFLFFLGIKNCFLFFSFLLIIDYWILILIKTCWSFEFEFFELQIKYWIVFFLSFSWLAHCCNKIFASSSSSFLLRSDLEKR